MSPISDVGTRLVRVRHFSQSSRNSGRLTKHVSDAFMERYGYTLKGCSDIPCLPLTLFKSSVLQGVRRDNWGWFG